METLTDQLVQILRSNDVELYANEPVKAIDFKQSDAKQTSLVSTASRTDEADLVISCISSKRINMICLFYLHALI